MTDTLQNIEKLERDLWEAADNLRANSFRELVAILPKHSLVTAFGQQAMDLLKQIRILKQQNEKLRAARNLLLPRLTTGEIAV